MEGPDLVIGLTNCSDEPGAALGITDGRQRANEGVRGGNGADARIGIEAKISRPALAQHTRNAPQHRAQARQRIRPRGYRQGGFAARQQELHARDYGPDFAGIHQRLDKANLAVRTLSERPAMQLTPAMIATQIRAASEQGRAADHQAWSIANQQLGNAFQSLNDVVASARTAEKQRLWIAGAAAAALVIGFAFGTIIPARIAQAVPKSWHWPEANAARILQRDGWSAGERLLQVSNPARWKQLTEAAQIAEQNAEALASCGERGARRGKPLDCVIKVGSAPSLAEPRRRRAQTPSFSTLP